MIIMVEFIREKRFKRFGGEERLITITWPRPRSYQLINLALKISSVLRYFSVLPELAQAARNLISIIICEKILCKYEITNKYRIFLDIKVTFTVHQHFWNKTEFAQSTVGKNYTTKKKTFSKKNYIYIYTLV